MKAELEVHHADHAGFAHRIAHRASLCHRACHRLLAEDVFAGAGSRDRERRVRRRRSCDGDRVEIGEGAGLVDRSARGRYRKPSRGIPRTFDVAADECDDVCHGPNDRS